MNLAARVEGLARVTSLWEPHVRHDPEQRIFHRVAEEHDFEAWLICWMPGHDTGFHDHDLSSGAVTVLRGRVREERLLLGAPVRSVEFGAGETFEFAPWDIHRVTHAGTEPAVSLHVYSPRLMRMGAYATGDDGTLQRHPVADGKELVPLGVTSP